MKGKKIGEYSLTADQRRFRDVMKEAAVLRWRKLNDYGASYRNFGSFGVAVRMGDKMRRIERMMQKGHVQTVQAESVRDTGMDMVNYATMLVMLLDEESGRVEA